MTPTGWDTGLCRGYDRGLALWFATGLDARHTIRRWFGTLEIRMKELDDVMARDRAGMPVTYRDLLPVAERVAELEARLMRWRDLAIRFDAERMRARAHLQCLLDAPEKHSAEAAHFLQAAPHRPLGLFAEAFEKWENAYRNGETLSHEESAQQDVQVASVERAAYFLKLLGEVAP